MASTDIQKRNLYRLTLVNTSILSAYFYVFMEWVFFVTKPSSISNLPWFESLKVLILTGGAMALLPLAFAIIVMGLAKVINHPDLKKWITRVGYILPAFILSVTALIMLDNFIYTVFKVGIIMSEGALRIAYASAG